MDRRDCTLACFFGAAFFLAGLPSSSSPCGFLAVSGISSSATLSSTYAWTTFSWSSVCRSSKPSSSDASSKDFLRLAMILGVTQPQWRQALFFFPKKESVAKKKGYCRRKGRTSSFFLGSRRYFRISKHLLQLYSLQNKTRSLTRKQESNIHTRTRFGPCGQGCQNFFFFFSHKEWNRAIQLTFAFCARCGGVFKAVARHLLFFLGV